MPELPEVETVRIGLARHLPGLKITSAKALHPRLWRHQIKMVPGLVNAGLLTPKQALNPEEVFASVLTGNRVKTVARRGKFMWLVLENGALAVIHLGMSGQALLHEPNPSGKETPDASEYLAEPGESPTDLTARLVRRQGKPDDKHLRALLELEHGYRLRFIDQRTFGHITVCAPLATEDGYPGGFGSELAVIPEYLSHIERDLLDEALDVDRLIKRLKNTHRPVKTALLDQGLVSGVGSIYADEGCFLAGVRPGKMSHRLSAKQWHDVLEATAEVMRRALEVGGTSFDSLYVNVDGAPGFFARSLNVYGRAGKPCKTCGNVLQKTVIQGRSAVFCSHCQ